LARRDHNGLRHLESLSYGLESFAKQRNLRGP
jgi:hypothetical protein